MKTMTEMNEVSEQFTDSFAKVLNRNGYGFQFSILKKAKDLLKEGKTQLYFQASEFPVEVKGSGTRIDFVLLRGTHGWHPNPLYIIAECKRTNPALSNWCFVRAPYTHSSQYDGGIERIIIESLERSENNVIKSFAREGATTRRAYHLGFEVRSNQKGHSSGESGQAIESAATQVLRGLNGFIQTFTEAPTLGNYKQVDFLPVIFTTAQLYVSEANLSNADLDSGNLDLSKDKIESAPWLLYQYNQSPGLKHSAKSKIVLDNLDSLLRQGYTRTIAVVSSNGVEDFLQWISNLETVW